MDGVLASNSISGGLRDDFQPPPEMIEEMRLNAANTLEYGASAGIGVVVVTKSGTNQLHGSLLEYRRNDAVDAKNYFAANVTPNKQNEYGFTLGGQVVLPHIYNGRSQIGTDALGRPIYSREIDDPTTTRSVPDPSNPGQTGFVCDPFAYNGQLNVIPQSQTECNFSVFREVSSGSHTGGHAAQLGGLTNFKSPEY
jgi:hypothetical protein